MTNQYDLFEKFSDGSSLWRASVISLEGARIHACDLARRSPNKFYAMNVASGKIMPIVIPYGVLHPGSTVGRRSRGAAA